MPLKYEQRKAYVYKRRKDVIKFLREYKSDKSCKICGWNQHTQILNFHHRDPSQKKFRMTEGHIGNYSRKVVLEEMAKCDLLCPNCHVWLHFQEHQ